MKFSNWFKIGWWILIILISGFILYKRIDAIFKGNAISIDIIIFIVFIALMLVPVFSEIDLFGIKLKQEIEELKEYINIRLGDIKNELHSNHVQSVYIQDYKIPSPESKLVDIERKIKTEISPELKSYHLIKELNEIPDNNLLLFKVRYNIETELRRIWKEHYPKRDKLLSIIEITHDLLKENILNNILYNPLREIIAICNYAIHGEKVSDNQMKFIRNYANEVILYLKQQ